MRLPAKRLPESFDTLCLAAVYVFFVTVYLFQIDFDVYMIYNDGWYYLNRAWLHANGIFDEVSFYTLAYPLLVGAVNWLLRDLPLSAIVVNAVVQLFLLVGIYILGRQLAGRAVGLLAMILFALDLRNAVFAPLISADFLLMAMSVWTVVLGLELAKQPRKSTTVVLGMLMAVLPFVRIEGFVYGGLVLAGLLAVWLRQKRWHDIVQHGLILAPIVGLAWLGYVSWFLTGADMLEGVGGSVPMSVRISAYTHSISDTMGRACGVCSSLAQKDSDFCAAPRADSHLRCYLHCSQLAPPRTPLHLSPHPLRADHPQRISEPAAAAFSTQLDPNPRSDRRWAGRFGKPEQCADAPFLSQPT